MTIRVAGTDGAISMTEGLLSFAFNDTTAILLALCLGIASYVLILVLILKLRRCSRDAWWFFFLSGVSISGFGIWSSSFILVLALLPKLVVNVTVYQLIMSLLFSCIVVSALLSSLRFSARRTVLVALGVATVSVFVHVLNLTGMTPLVLTDVSITYGAVSVVFAFIGLILILRAINTLTENKTQYVILAFSVSAAGLLAFFALVAGLDSEPPANGKLWVSSPITGLTDLEVMLVVFVTSLLWAFYSLISKTKNLRPGLMLKVSAFISLMLVLAIFTTGTSFYSVLENIKVHEYMGKSKQISTLGAEYFENVSKSVVAQLRLLAGNQDVKSFMQSGSQKKYHARVSALFKSYMQGNPVVWQARIIAGPESGFELLRVQRFDRQVMVFGDVELQNKSHREYYKKIISKKPGEVYISEVELSRENGEISEPYTLTYRIGTPVYDDNGRLRGVVVVNVNFQHLMEISLPGGDGAFKHYVLNEHGRYLVHPDKTIGETMLNPESVELDALIPGLGHFFQGDAIRMAPRLVDAATGKALVGAYKVFYSPGDLGRWIMFVSVVDNFFAESSTHTMILKILQMSMLFSVIAAAIVVMLSRYIISPLSTLAQAYQRFSDQGSVPEIVNMQDDEIGDLAASFSDMCQMITQKEAVLTEKSEFLNTILHNTYDGIIVIDESGTVHTMNKAAEAMFLRRASDLVGRNVNEIVPVPHRQAHDGYIQNYLRTGQAKIIGIGREVEALRSDSTKIDIELGITELVKDGKRFFVGTLKDITQKKDAERELRRRQLELVSILDAAIDGIVIIDDSGTIQSVNPAALKMLDYGTKELVGEKISQILPGALEKTVALAFGENSGIRNEVEATRKDGKKIPIDLSISEVEVDGRTIYTGIMRDISERKKQDDELRQALEQLTDSRTELLIVNQKLEDANRIDPLTNIYNRRYFEEVFEIEFMRARRNRSSLGVLMLDVDFFKNYNDYYGHQHGDECLRTVARVIRETLKRPADIVARYGGEEFILLMPETDKDGTAIVAENIANTLRVLQVPHAASPIADHVTISIGVYFVTPDKNMRKEDIVKYADEALYEAKEKGRDRVVLRSAD